MSLWQRRSDQQLELRWGAQESHGQVEALDINDIEQVQQRRGVSGRGEGRGTAL